MLRSEWLDLNQNSTVPLFAGKKVCPPCETFSPLENFNFVSLESLIALPDTPSTNFKGSFGSNNIAEVETTGFPNVSSGRRVGEPKETIGSIFNNQ